MIFRVQWGQKSPKSGKMCLTKMYLLLPAAPLQGPCAVPLQDLGTFWSNTFFHLWAIFDPAEP